MLGQTPLIRLTKSESYFQSKNRLYAKVENTNPTGSIKDRAVFQMLEDFKNEGKIRKDTVILEATSGNTGISLAYFGREMGVRTLIVMPESMSEERRRKITEYGAELYLIKGGMTEAEKKAEELLAEIPNSILLNQFKNPSNPKAHYLHTGPEICEALPTPDYLFAGIGSGGTISGIGQYLKENTDAKVIGIEPWESAVLHGQKAAPHLIQGIGADFIPDTLNLSLIDEIQDVKGEEAIKTAKKIREQEGLDIGISSGACLAGALEYAKEKELEEKNFVLIFPDKGDRYSW